MSIKQSFWINAILAAVFSYLFVTDLLHLHVISLVLDTLFLYLSASTLYTTHWRPRNYPFNRAIFRGGNTYGSGKRW